MKSHLDLAVVDADGALRESAEAVEGSTRADIFRKAAVGGGAIVGAGFFGGMLPQLADARPSKRQDIAILKYALTLEYLEAAFYREAVAAGGLSGPQLELARLLADHEQTHVTALRRTIRQLGGKAPAAPGFDFKDTNKGAQFIQTALVLENTGVRAYLGQAPRLHNKAVLAAAGAIVTVEARHAAAVAVLINESPFAGAKSVTPYGAFDRATSMKRILSEVGATGFIAG